MQGGGTSNLNGNYASPTIFGLKPAVGEVYRVYRMLVSIVYGPTPATTPATYGNIPALTNGVSITVNSDSGAWMGITSFPIKQNSHWGAHCYDQRYDDWGGAGDDSFNVRWSFTKEGGPIILDGDRGHEIRITLNDDFTGLDEHRFTFKYDTVGGFS